MGMKFTPCANYQIAVSAASNSVTLNTQATNADDVYLYNGGTVVTFVRWGAGAQTALPTDFPIAPGAWFIVTKGNTVNTIAAIGTSGTLYVSPGESA